MRWDNLFDDLESQLERELSAEELDVSAEEERLRLGRLGVRDRLIAIHADAASRSDYSIRLSLVSGERMTVRPATFGRDWFSADVLGDSSRVERCIVVLSGIAGISLEPTEVAASLRPSDLPDGHPSLSERLGLPFVLRDLCRRRRSVELVLSASTVRGTIDRVGRDHVDVAVHERGSARRESAVSEVRLVPLAAVLMVRL
jgi:hypothetical protein